MAGPTISVRSPSAAESATAVSHQRSQRELTCNTSLIQQPSTLPNAQERVEHQRLADGAGGVTVEAAFAIAALVVVLILCVAGLTAVSMQVRCIDAAREAARLAARGDDGSASGAAQGIAPDGAAVRLRRDGEFVIARVTANSPLLPGITIAAEAVAAAEPGPR